MSIRLALLALLGHEPMYGYQLRAEFEGRTGGTWPLNIGQIYSTLDRLERDGLVEVASDVDAAGHVVHEITAAGRGEVAAWFAEPVVRAQPARDELAIKLAIAVTMPGVDVDGLIQRQRSATVAMLQDYTRLKRETRELAWSLVLESLVFAAEAEVRWLDHCEARVRRAADQPSPTTSSTESSAASSAASSATSSATSSAAASPAPDAGRRRARRQVQR